jgi:hypothetical protein
MFDTPRLTYQLSVVGGEAKSPSSLAHLSQLAGLAARETAPDGHRSQKVCTTGAMFSFRSKLSARANPRRRLRSQREVALFEQEFVTGGWHFKNITATDSTPKYHAVKGLGLEQRHFGEPVPLFKRLGGRFFPKNSSFQRPVEKVGLRMYADAGAIGPQSSWLRKPTVAYSTTS